MHDAIVARVPRVVVQAYTSVTVARGTRLAEKDWAQVARGVCPGVQQRSGQWATERRGCAAG
eukprot:12133-Prymnesium_polylepis.1